MSSSNEQNDDPKGPETESAGADEETQPDDQQEYPKGPQTKSNVTSKKNKHTVYSESESDNEMNDEDITTLLIDEQNPDTVDKEDDYPEELDKLQLKAADKHRFIEVTSNMHLVVASTKGDTPSLQQVNRLIILPNKQRDRRRNRLTASTQSRKVQEKSYHSYVASNPQPIKNLTIEELKRIFSKLASVQEIDLYHLTKNIVEMTFPDEIYIKFTTSIRRLPLRGKFNLSLDTNKRLILKWWKMSIYQLRNLIEILYKKMEIEASNVTPVTQDNIEILQGLVRDQILSILQLENHHLLNPETYNQLLTEFEIGLKKNPTAALHYALSETQYSLTKYAHHYLLNKAKSQTNVLQTRVTQLTTLLEKAWY